MLPCIDASLVDELEIVTVEKAYKGNLSQNQNVILVSGAKHFILLQSFKTDFIL